MNTFDDPRLTAYVLGELDQDGRNFIENEMDRHNECRFEARELAEFTDKLRAALKTELMPKLGPKEESAIAARLRQTGTRRKPFLVPIASNWLLRAELAVVVMLALWFVPIPAGFSTPVRQLFANASAQTARVLLQVVGTHCEWRGTSLILPVPAPLLPMFPPGVKVPPGFKVPPRTIAINFETWTCNPRFWTVLLFITGFLLGNLYIRSPGRKLTLIALAIPLVILFDALRRFAMAEWLVHKPGAADSPLFYVSQPLFVVFSLLALIPFFIWLRWSERKRKPSL